MPRFAISNSSKRRARLRTSAGLISLAPGAAGPADGYEMAPALADYYRKSGLTVVALDGDPAAPGGGAKPGLTDLSAEDTLALADKEKIDLGDLDLSSADDLATAHRLIAEFRRIYESGTADMLREQAEKVPGVDADELKAATTKYAIVNLMIAAQGVPGADA